MLTKQENDELTRVGRGTPAGELLRRYWHPIAVAQELTEERPKKRVRLLGEDLVVFRDGKGGYGLVAEQCQHRGASLYYGFLEDGCIRCPYHGWLYDKTGRCIEQPFEPAQSLLRHTIQLPAYPVEKVRGLLFAYLGPLPAPVIPPWDVIAREDGTHRIEVHPVLNCNWLQVQETNADPAHKEFLHGKMGFEKGVRKQWKFQPMVAKFELFQWGLTKPLEYTGDDPFSEEGGQPAVFPNILRHTLGDGSIDMHWRTPIDDTHTQTFWLGFDPSPDGTIVEEPEDPPFLYIELKNADGEFHLKSFPSQDSMAWETQGPLRDRSVEHLGASDEGVVMWRQLLTENIDKVRRGEDPMCVIRDSNQYRVIEFLSIR